MSEATNTQGVIGVVDYNENRANRLRQAPRVKESMMVVKNSFPSGSSFHEAQDLTTHGAIKNMGVSLCPLRK